MAGFLVAKIEKLVRICLDHIDEPVRIAEDPDWEVAYDDAHACLSDGASGLVEAERKILDGYFASIAKPGRAYCAGTSRSAREAVQHMCAVATSFFYAKQYNGGTRYPGSVGDFYASIAVVEDLRSQIAFVQAACAMAEPEIAMLEAAAGMAGLAPVASAEHPDERPLDCCV